MISKADVLLPLERAVRQFGEAPARYSGDYVVLAAYPRSGTTWMRFILSNLSRILGSHPDEVDFHTVARYAPEIRGNRQLKGAILTPGFPLFLKTHFPYISAFDPYRCVVIVRDPLDVMVSYYAYMTGAHGRRYPSMSAFVRHWRRGMPNWVYFHRSWIGKPTAVVRYEDMLDDTVGTVVTMLDRLGVSVPTDAVSLAVERSSKENMRRLQAERGDPHNPNPNFQFVGKATKGEGKRKLSPEDIQYVRRQAGDLEERLLALQGMAPPA